jgi:uncharacterized damage-inducible protein DinB
MTRVPDTAARAVIAKALRLSYDGPAWHGPAVFEALAQVDAATADARPIAGAHTIRELTHHLSAWTNEVTRRVRGAPSALPLEGDWPTSAPAADPAASWAALRAALTASRDDVLAALDAFPVERLGERVGVIDDASLGAYSTYRQMLLGLVQHNSYHGGQIMLLRRAIEG